MSGSAAVGGGFDRRGGRREGRWWRVAVPERVGEERADSAAERRPVGRLCAPGTEDDENAMNTMQRRRPHWWPKCGPPATHFAYEQPAETTRRFTLA